MNWQLYLVLGTPLLGGILLALWGHKTWAAGLNIAMCIATFIASAALTAHIISEGPLVTADKQFSSTRSMCSWSRSPPSFP